MRNNTKSSIIAYQAGWQHTTAAITSNTPLCNLELLETDVLIAIEAFLRAQEIIINQLQLATKQLADDRDKTGRLTSLALQPAGCDKRLSDWVKNNKEVIIKCTPFEMCYHCVPITQIAWEVIKPFFISAPSICTKRLMGVLETTSFLNNLDELEITPAYTAIITPSPSSTKNKEHSTQTQP